MRAFPCPATPDCLDDPGHPGPAAAVSLTSTAAATRRRLLRLGAACASATALPAWAEAPSPRMTEGPFYPPARWRQQATDWDADLTQVRQGGQVLQARGELLALGLRVIDTDGRPLRGASVEIWQCDEGAVYRHPSVDQRDPPADPGFQGFGAAGSDADGQVRFRTIKPVSYPGRTPHIHIKLELAGYRPLTSQLFVAGEPGNARDGLYSRLGADGRAALTMALQPAQDNSLRWRAQHTLVLAGA